MPSNLIFEYLVEFQVLGQNMDGKKHRRWDKMQTDKKQMVKKQIDKKQTEQNTDRCKAKSEQPYIDFHSYTF